MKKNEIKVPLWEQEVPSICRFCAYAKRFNIREEVMCEKKGRIFPEDNTCKKFVYDILKIDTVRRKQERKKYNKEQFQL